jgi:hypothetical protein
VVENRKFFESARQMRVVVFEVRIMGMMWMLWMMTMMKMAKKTVQRVMFQMTTTVKLMEERTKTIAVIAFVTTATDAMIELQRACWQQLKKLDLRRYYKERRVEMMSYLQNNVGWWREKKQKMKKRKKVSYDWMDKWTVMMILREMSLAKVERFLRRHQRVAGRVG